MQTLVIWSASGRTLGVTLSSILTCSLTSSGILFNSAGLMVLSYNKKKNKKKKCRNGYINLNYSKGFLYCSGDLLHLSARGCSSWSVSRQNYWDCDKYVFSFAALIQSGKDFSLFYENEQWHISTDCCSCQKEEYQKKNYKKWMTPFNSSVLQQPPSIFLWWCLFQVQGTRAKF